MNRGITSAGATTSEMVFSAIMFGISTVVTIAFAYYLVTDAGKLTEAWQYVRGLPLILQLVVWLLLLPWMIALWIWTLPWALWIRVVLVVAILIWTEWLLFPWKS
jgi:hypothetical protein